jgi:hypothetical protein
MTSLLEAGCGSLLNYSVEAEDIIPEHDGQPLWDAFVASISQAIEQAANFPPGISKESATPLRSSWVAIKRKEWLCDLELAHQVQ